MTTAIRFKDVINATGAALTKAGVPNGDGDDKLYRIIQRNIVAADIGTGAGQSKDNTGNVNGVGIIIGTIESTDNVLCLEATTYRTSGTSGYVIDNAAVVAEGPLIYQAQFLYTIADDYTIRLLDATNALGPVLAAGDYCVIRLTLGTGVNWLT